MNVTRKLDAEHKRRRREYFIILGVIPLIALLTYIESHISLISGDVPIPTNIFILGLINLNVILLIVVIFLVLRNSVKLFMERKHKVMGSRLMTKLITAFVSLTIIPTFILFFVVIAFINKSIDGWFDIKIEDSLKESLELAQNYYRDTSERMLAGARIIAAKAGHDAIVLDSDRLEDFIATKMEENDFSSIEVFSTEGTVVVSAISDSVNKNMVPDAGLGQIEKALGGEASSFVQTMNLGDVVRAAYPVLSEDAVVEGAVVVSYYVPRSLMGKMKEISAAFEGYKQLKLLKNPVKVSYFVILLIITLLLLFFSLWIGRYLAKQITQPIHELADGTNEVASGNLDYRINMESDDEIGLLVKSFNRMTEDLKAGKTRIEEANIDLRLTNTELEQRRRYIEIVLDNVTAGIISIDRLGKITSINRVAAEILGTKEAHAIEKNYKDVLREEDRVVFRDMIRQMNEMGAETMERQIRLQVRDKTLMVLVNLNALRDESGSYLGMVAVLDDLTHLLKTQRMQAWKEVAKRIAHEIKNPLTPIKLSAQRLRKKYLDDFPEGNVFDDCTKTIIKQVDELKSLVNEFSNFARMPAVHPGPNDLNEIVSETLALYKAGQKKISYEIRIDERLPVLEIDRDQMKRVIINLIDNAVAAVGDEGYVRVETHFMEDLQVARLEVIDNGTGISGEAKQRLFEPYFSTKRSGTGLGLAIVSNIIADHSGYIRVRDNEPTGTRFIIELPVKVASI
ncbi:MAG: ATP-binding protein [Thermodesulfobacteriota bacterium]|nr:MAG: ATP-binding protein [Thermodesulfobacteriota bacterium]